ncbi:hypothetical protein JHD48_03665 [Sulfurimonas sp. SAG-AH-194-I05]|nr:ATP-binding protein [Sulfurimonas sp. SAG-AH-194-I05]MDF1874833.1 hypothetical protein [Sulfurimonas sp. SAG-AH-194-I05]
MSDAKWIRRLERERNARKEAENLLESKSLELWDLNQSLEATIEQRTADLQVALSSAQKANTAKDEFLSNMSHEIRTPLNAIIGFVDIMLKKEMPQEKRNRYLGIIQQSGKNLLRIINDILDFSKIQSGKFSIFRTKSDLRDILTNNCKLLQSQARKKDITFTVDFNETFPQTIISDDARIIQILNNFVSNAIKFTDNNGTVNVYFSYDAVQKNLELRVKDNGIGIDAKAQEKIFTPFEQENASTTKEYGGTGLGLSISLSLIALMDGELIFESTKGEGSVFGFTIPIASIPDTIEQT